MLKPTGVHTLVRRTHEERILRVLRKHGALTRAEISRHVGLSRTTLSEITADLLDRGAILVQAGDGTRQGRGRPAEKLVLDPGAGQFIGVDFGLRRVRVVVANASHEILMSGVASYGTDSHWSERTQVAFALIDSAGVEAGVHFEAVQAVGVGCPEPFSPLLARNSAEATIQAQSKGVDFVQAEFERRFSAEVVVDNNTRLAGLGEAIWDSASDARNLLYVRLSDGVGGSLVVDGRLVTGGAGFAGQFGHMTVDPYGPECRCGKRGCLETIVASEAIFASCRTAGVQIHSLEELEAAVTKGDPIVLGILRQAGSALGRVLGSIAVAVDPSEIVIGGRILEFADVILEQARATIEYELFPFAGSKPSIRRARFGDESGAIGAVATLFHSGSPLLANYSAVSSEPSAESNRTLRSSAMNRQTDGGNRCRS